MGLSQDYQKKIKESMDMDEGGRLHAIADKAAAVNAPVLIIGLGGSGMDSLLATKKLIYDIIQREKKLDGKYADKPRNIEYLGIDTDQSYLNKSYQGIRLNKNAGEVKIYTMPNVQPVLQHPELLPEYVNRWLDTSLENDSVINGAGAVRQLGRLLLMQNISDVISVLEEKIKKVTVGFDTKTPLYVFIIAGISGGTGSGTFIDIPYLVQAVASNISARPVQKIGLLFLPDVNANKDGIAAVGKSSLYANGFAALKELDYLMNIEHEGDCFEQNYGTYKVGTKGGGAAKPYDICLLLSSKGKDGAQAASGNEGYELVTHVVAETIFNFVLGDSGAKDFSDFSINAWLSNEVKNMSIYRTLLGDHKHPVSYVYSIAGASSAKLPMDDVMSYLAFKMYEEVQNFWDQRPTDQDIDAVEKYFHLAKNMINAEARANLPHVNTTQIDAKTAIQSHPQVVQLFEGALKKQKEVVVANLQHMLDVLQENIDDKNNIINQYFVDMEKGPVFAQQCLYSSYHKSTITDLRQYKLDFAGAIPGPDQLNSLNQQVALAHQDLSKALLKGGKLTVYLQKMEQLYNAKLTEFVNEQLITFCANADSILTDKNNEIFEVVSDLLRQMMPIFETYGSIKTSATKTKTKTGTTLSWTMVDTPAFIKELENRMNQNPQFSVNLREVVQNFYKYLFENIDKWQDENQDAVEDLNTFIYRQFNTILDNSMDFFLEIIAQSQGKTLNEYCTDIIAELTRQSDVRYPIDSAFVASAVTQPGYSFISIPNNSPHLMEAARAAAAASATAGGASSIVKASGVRDRIFMMTFMSATPLSLNQDIKQFY
ncbi:MAG: tubulin-like doman-containing protein, partial [Lachnospiraceae bacterium]|nr:tubulin-like doman-containing protein [Lachnospiraceae bacterium]